jgi:putative glutamine amidotransferase
MAASITTGQLLAKLALMPRPLIGVCAAVERASYGVWKDEPAVLLPLAYARAIHGAGGMMAMLPPDRRASEDPAELLDRFDALILGGGADIDPELQGAEPHPETVGTNPDRDRFELALARGALEREVPLLAVCRGMQVLNVVCGGTLDQHIPERLGHEIHRPVPGSWAEHDVRIEPGSLAAQATGTGRLTVKSHHHQGLDTIAENLRPSAWATDDGTVEAVESPKGDFVLGVLWHPEEDPDDRVIAHLIDRAATAQG